MNFCIRSNYTITNETYDTTKITFKDLHVYESSQIFFIIFSSLSSVYFVYHDIRLSSPKFAQFNPLNPI